MSSTPHRTSGLRAVSIGSWATIGMIVGTNIGAGVLSIAYKAKTAHSGYMPLLLTTIIACILCMATMLFTAEVCIRTKGNLQLSGLAEKYLGKIGSFAIFIAVSAVCYGALVAYLDGSGQIIGDLLASIPGIEEHFSLATLQRFGSFIFFIPSILILYLGLKALGAGQKVISTVMISIMVALVFITAFYPSSSLQNLLEPMNWGASFNVFHIGVFIFASQYIVPELVRGNLDQPEKIPSLIVTGMVITLCIVLAIPAAIIGLVGLENVSQVSSSIWGKTLGNYAFYSVNVFALLAMMTSYWGLGGALFTNLFDYFKLGDETNIPRRILVLLMVAIPPFALVFSNQASFSSALDFAGLVGGTLLATIPIFLLVQARKHSDRTPEFTCGWYAHPIALTLLFIVFATIGCYRVYVEYIEPLFAVVG